MTAPLTNASAQAIGTALSAFQFSTTGSLIVGGLNPCDRWLPGDFGYAQRGTGYEAISGTLTDIASQYNALVSTCARNIGGAVKTRWGNADISMCQNRDALRVQVSPVGQRSEDSLSIFMGCGRTESSVIGAELQYMAITSGFSILQIAHSAPHETKALAIRVGGKFLQAVGAEPATSGSQAWKNILSSMRDGLVMPLTAFYISSLICRRFSFLPTPRTCWVALWTKPSCVTQSLESNDGWLKLAPFLKTDFSSLENLPFDNVVEFWMYPAVLRSYDWGVESDFDHYLRKTEIPMVVVRYVPPHKSLGFGNEDMDYPVIDIIQSARMNPKHVMADLVEAAAKMRPDVFPLKTPQPSVLELQPFA
jgi:hypothetical protein